MLGVVLVGDLEGDFDGRRTAVGIKDLVEPLGARADELARQLDRRHAGKAQERGVGDAVELLANGPVDLGDAVPVDVAPQRRDAVEIAVSFGVDQEETVGRGDDRGPLRPGRPASA